MPTWCDECLRMVGDCEKRESRLTEWERGFIASIRSRLESEKPLTANQTEALDRTWERVTAKG